VLTKRTCVAAAVVYTCYDFINGREVTAGQYMSQAGYHTAQVSSCMVGLLVIMPRFRVDQKLHQAANNTAAGDVTYVQLL
jgi:hypothetical protein